MAVKTTYGLETLHMLSHGVLPQTAGDGSSANSSSVVTNTTLCLVCCYAVTLLYCYVALLFHNQVEKKTAGGGPSRRSDWDDGGQPGRQRQVRAAPQVRRSP